MQCAYWKNTCPLTIVAVSPWSKPGRNVEAGVVIFAGFSKKPKI